MSYDVIIIGAGMSGLAAGIRLAYYEKKVCILEKHTRPGGLNSYYTKSGRTLDTGLHAMTNFVRKGIKNAPLSKLLRQLRLKYEDFSLCEQKKSEIGFPDVSLLFDNNPETFRQEIEKKFPNQIDNFNRLCSTILSFDELNLDAKPISSRNIISSFITDPLLIEMLYCPLSYYGSAREDDMDFDQFVIMFKSIFMEGFARPKQGVRQIIQVLLDKYNECGGELKLNTAVQEILTANKKVSSVKLTSGKVLEATKVLSSAGFVETMHLTGEHSQEIDNRVGNLSFIEIIYRLDRTPADLGIDRTILFYNDSQQFKYRKPKTVVDISSGVVCCPNNFNFQTPLPEGMIRVTHMANHDLWDSLSPQEYEEEKLIWQEKSLEKICRLIPDFSSAIVFTDMFTPKTIQKYTSHLGGAVYGSPLKVKNGKTSIENLFLCGTDQGFIGIVGALLSGISMANLHVLR